MYILDSCEILVQYISTKGISKIFGIFSQCFKHRTRVLFFQKYSEYYFLCVFVFYPSPNCLQINLKVRRERGKDKFRHQNVRRALGFSSRPDESYEKPELPRRTFYPDGSRHDYEISITVRIAVQR